MSINKYLTYFLRDFLIAFGCLMAVASMLLALYSTRTINTSLLYQLILVALVYTFYKFGLVNTHELGKKAQMISFTICFLLADVMILLWLCFFSPNKITDKSTIIAYILVFIIVKGAVYIMMQVDGKRTAKQLNVKLGEYKNGGSE